MEFNHRPFLLHGLLLFFFVSIFLIHTGEKLVEFFFLLDLPVFILCSSKGLIILYIAFNGSDGQADDGTYIGASLLGFILAFLLFRIVGILVLRQPPKSRHSPDTSPDSTAEDATVIRRKRRFSFCCLLYSS